MRFVATEDLMPGMKVGRKIINRKSASVLEKGMELTGTHIEHLKNSGYLGIYITDDFSKDVEIQEIVTEEVILNGVDAVARADVGKIIDVASELTMGISSLETIRVDLLDLRNFDDYTYQHSVNVAIYAAAVAARMEVSQEELQEVTVTGLCHDLGKTRIPTSILNKKGRLTDEEYAEVKRHPRYSYEILKDHPGISSAVRQAVLCHHENENGSGYPDGRIGDEIPLYAKILHAVDVYDALTSNRPYQEPYAPVEALEYMKGGMDVLFDRRVVEVMQKVIPAYPPGMDVILSTGERALVLAHTPDALRPKIKLYQSGKVVDLSRNLEYLSTFITMSGSMLTRAQEKVAVLNENRGESRSGDRPPEILVVDDSVVSLMQTRSALDKEGYHVTVLESALACLNYIKAKGAPDLLIADIEMPMINGVSMVEKLRQQGHRHLKVLFLTGVASRETVLRCRKVGAKDYILKPFSPIYLRERVRVALDQNLDR
ncbi:MAG: response regulator [Lachnospiraceae bacterium]|nr:response regulator [Lachnospiraceae bacterium]